MEPQPPPPSSTPPLPAISPRPPIAPSKIRLMCSYGGHIVPRPHDKSLFYATGETRIVSVDRRTTAASLPALSTHLSRTLFHNRSFHLKYQLPDEDLDSLISVITDDDLANMIEEHDRISPPARIRLFLFPVKPESVGSALLDPKSESWFSDALKSTRILQKGQSADSGLLMGFGSELEVSVEGGSNSGGGGEGKLGAESLVLETSSSFGSTSSSFSMSNSPPIGIVNCDEKGSILFDTKNMVPSSASIESENRIGSLAAHSKTGVLQEPLIQVGPEESPENLTGPSIDITTQQTVQVLGYPLSQLPGGIKQQQETPLVQGGLHYVPQFAGQMPISPYYPVYQMPTPPQQISCPPNQPYPIYLVPVRQSQYHNMSMLSDSFDVNTTSPSSRPPLHPQTAVLTQSIAHNDVFGSQMAEMATKAYCSSIAASTQLSNRTSNQGQLVMVPSEPQTSSEPVTSASTISAIQGSEFDEDVAYNQIYKSQPSLPVFPSQYQTMSNGTTMLSEPSVHTMQPTALHPQ